MLLKINNYKGVIIFYLFLILVAFALYYRAQVFDKQYVTNSANYSLNYSNQ